MTQPLQDWARRAATLPAVIVQTTPRAVHAGAEQLEMQARTNLRSASGGDQRLSRVRSGKGARVDVQIRVRGSGSGAQALVLPTGPVSLVENDTRAHVQPFRYVAERTGGRRTYSMARRRRAQRSPVMVIPGIGVRTHVRHPGTRGQHPVARAMQMAGREAGQAGAEVFARAVRDHMSG
jgi:hypothetical protein